MELNMILCVTEDYLLGDSNPEGNGLLWHVKDELSYFKERTVGQVVIFGKKTADCVPLELMRKNRIVEVLRSNMKIEDIMEKYRDTNKQIIIAGGAIIYKYFLENYDLDKIYLSVLKKHVPVKESANPIYLDKNLLAKYKHKTVVKEYPDFTAYCLTK